MTRLSGLLKALEPRYWDFRAPEPVTIADLTRGGKTSPPLLHQGELLILFLVPPGADHGLVFAISRAGSAWAPIQMRGDKMAAVVTRLRQQIDPGGYGIPRDAPDAGWFDRDAAYQLYRTLFGAPALEKLLAPADTLLIVPSGPLLSLTPGVLVTRRPDGVDSDPSAQRRTSWLLRDKAIAILPTAASLRTLRALAHPPADSPVPLAGFADPDFAGTTPVAKRGAGMIRADGFFRDGKVDSRQLAMLPRLPGTRQEGIILERELDAPGGILFGSEATKTQLNMLNDSGLLGGLKLLSLRHMGWSQATSRA